MSQGGRKYDQGKSELGLIPRYSIEQVGLVLAYGREKYGEHNWRKGLLVQRNINAALRHIYAANEREDIDSDSGLPHLAHALCCIMFALDTIKTLPQFDDRFQKEEYLSDVLSSDG